MIVMSSRNGSSGARLLGDRSKARPTSAGAHMFFLMPKAVLPAEPCTISMAAKRTLPRTACAEARAGTMASRNGSAMVTPAALSTVRRDICFWVRYIVSAPALKGSDPWLPLTLRHSSRAALIVAPTHHAHLEGGAVHPTPPVGRKLVALFARVPHDPADSRHIGVLEATAQCVCQQALGKAREKHIRVLQERFTQSGGTVHAGAVI